MPTAKVLNLSLIPHTSPTVWTSHYHSTKRTKIPSRPQSQSNTNNSKALKTIQIEVFHCWLRFPLRSTLHRPCFILAREGKLYVRTSFELRRLISEYASFFRNWILAPIRRKGKWIAPLFTSLFTFLLFPSYFIWRAICINSTAFGFG